VRLTFKLLFVSLMLMLVYQPILGQDADNISINWNQDILIVLNTSGESVNASNMDFVSGNGAVMATDWVMNTYGDSNLSYSLAELQPGACLLAYLSADEQPALPENVECTLTVGIFTMTNFDDIVWDVAQGGFSVVVDGASVADCEITGNSCGASIATTASNANDATEVAEDDSQADLLVAWNTDVFVIVNTSDDEVTVADLSFTSSQGAILPENWVMNPGENNILYSLDDLASGSCLIAYLSADEQPALPENVICTQTEGVFTMTNINDMVWDVSHGGFSAAVGGATIVTCDINATTCVVSVATTSASSDDMVAMDDDEAQSIRAIWNTDIFVVVNTSEVAVDVANLSFASSQGQILPENWSLNTFGANNLLYSLEDFAPGSCLIAYLSADEQPTLPDNVTCTRTEGVFTMTNISDVVWDVSQGGFSALMSGVVTTECDINRTRCDIGLGG